MIRSLKKNDTRLLNPANPANPANPLNPGSNTCSEYIYLGDRNTDPSLKKIPCKAVLRSDGKCIRGRNGSMLVEMNDGKKMIVTGRLLRKTNQNNQDLNQDLND